MRQLLAEFTGLAGLTPNPEVALLERSAVVLTDERLQSQDWPRTAASGPGLNEKNYTPTQVTAMKRAQPERETIPWPADGAEAPQGLELRHLRHFVAVADAGSFTRAAERIFIAQTALSQQIRHLEQIVGTPLLHRRRDGLRLTTTGGVLLDASRTVLSLVDHEVSRTRQAAGLGQPRLRRVIPPGLPEDLAVKATAALQAAATSLANTQSRAELSASRARIAAAADETRRRLERDLHDGIQQRLVWLGLKAQMIQTMTPRPADNIQRELSLLADGLFTALDELREISHGIHPAVLSEAGLGPALEALARRSAVPVELDLNLGPPMGQQVEAAAYYTASEALANAAKHAQATVIDLRVQGDDSALTLSIRDDGIGGADPSRGSGITGLKDRVEALGGTISVLSPPGHGTALHVRLPAGPSPVTRADGSWREDTITDAGGYPAAREPEGYRPTADGYRAAKPRTRLRRPILLITVDRHLRNNRRQAPAH